MSTVITHHNMMEHSKKIYAMIETIKNDPLYVALIEKEDLDELYRNVECLLQDCIDEYNYLIARNKKLIDECDSLEYERDVLQEKLETISRAY